MDFSPGSLRDFFTSTRWYQLLVVFATLVFACLGVAALMKEEQMIVALFLVLGILAFPAVVMNPRWGLVAFLWLVHTIDGVKRLVYGVTTFTLAEVAKILIVPVIFAFALYVRVFLLSWFGSGTVERVNLPRFWPLVLANLAAFAFVVRDGFGAEALVANYNLVCYVPAGIIIPHIIFNTERRLAYAKTLFVIGLVLGAYGIIQALHGPFDYELDYMLSGLTITIGSIEGQAYFRAFSFMNNGATFGGTMVMITILSYFYFCREDGRLRLKRSVVLMSLFAIGTCFAATQRGPIVSFILTLVFLPLFSRPRAFFVVSAIAVVGFAGVIMFADQLLDFLRIANDTMVTSTDNAFLQQNVSVLTYAQRLNGFSAMSNPDLWTPFGVTTRMGKTNIVANDIAYGHDLISNFLEWFGYIGTGAFLLLSGCFVYVVISRVREMMKTPERALWAQCNLGVFLFMMIWQLLTGPALMVSPLQLYFWVAVGNIIYLVTEPATESSSVESGEQRGLWKPRAAALEPILRPTV